MTEEEYVVFIQPYEDALKNIRVRVEVLNDDYRRKYQNYPIHHGQDRIKKKESIEQKLIRRGYESDVESARDCLTDISGIRVICYFVRDIYAVVSLLKKQTDIVVIKECDYISNPKPNGYRSYHIVFGVPVYHTAWSIIPWRSGFGPCPWTCGRAWNTASAIKAARSWKRRRLRNSRSMQNI